MNLTRATLCGLYKYSGAMYAHEQLAHFAGRRFMTVLLFHRVTDLIPEDGLTVSLARFRLICRLLSRAFNVVELSDIFRIVRNREPIPRRAVAITFDDSYRDNLDAARILNQFGLPATFFVPTAFIGTDRQFDWDRGLPRMPNLTWEDLREMVRLGHDIGSHTVTHANLGTIEREQAWTELSASRAIIEEQLGRRPRWFAYPYGGEHHLRPEYLPLIEQAGYEGTVSAFGGFVTAQTDPRVLPREALTGFQSMTHLEMHLSGCLTWLHALKSRLGLGTINRLSPYQYPLSQPSEPAHSPAGMRSIA